MDNLSQAHRDKSKQVRTALLSRTFKPLPPEPLEEDELVKFTPVSTSKAEYNKIVEKSLQDQSRQGNSVQEPRQKQENPFAKAILWATDVKPVQPLKRDDTLQSIHKIVNAGVVIAHPLETLGRTVKAMAHEAHADWVEAGERSKIAKEVYKEAYAKRKYEVRKEKRQQAINEAEKDAKYHAETTFGERRKTDVKKAMNTGKKAVKVGIRTAGKIVEELEQTPLMKNVKAQGQVEYKQMKHASRRTRESIEKTGNKRNLTASSLNKSREFPYVKKNELEGQKPQKVKQAKQTITKIPQQTAQANNTTTTKANNPLGASRHKTAFRLVKRNHGGLGNNQRQNPVLNVTKIATPSGLARKTHSGVV